MGYASTISKGQAAALAELQLKEVTLLSGCVHADQKALEGLCENIFGPSQGWRPISNELYFELGRVPLATDSDRFSSFLCFRIEVERPCPETQQPERRFVISHAFVDNSWALIFGREVFGLPALFALFDWQDAQRKVSLSAEVVAGEGSPFREIIQLEWAEAADDRALRQHPIWPSASLGPTSQTDMAPGTTSTDTLLILVKQVRDAVYPARACYEDVVRGSTIADVPNGGIIGTRVSLTFSDYPGVTLRQGLGLSAGSPQESVASYRASDVTLRFGVSDRARPTLRTGRSGAAFRSRPTDPLFAPEYEFRQVETVGLRLPVRRRRLEALCQRYLNEPFPHRGYAYAPASSEIVIECLSYGSMRSANPPLGVSVDDVGRQRELVFRMLVGRVDEGNRVARRPAIFCPFVFVDSSWSLISGREVAGYPKNLASFQTLGDSRTRRIDGCRIYTQNMSSDSVATRTDLLLSLDCRVHQRPISIDEVFIGNEAHKEDAPASPERSRRSTEQVPQAWWNLADLQSDGAASDTFIRSWLEGGTLGYGFVQLKCLPDASSPDIARYIQLLEGDYILDRLDVAFPEHSAFLHFDEDSVVRKTFGLAQDLMIPTGSWYRSDSDFRLRITDPLR